MAKHSFLLRNFIAVAIITTPSLSVFPSTGWAQSGEIVVTTRKREERLQDVPISISVADFEQLKRTGAKGLEDVLNISPSFVYDEVRSQKDVRISVRGLSPTRGRSNVAFLVDGIDVTSESFNSAGASILVSQRLLSDVQRVELVKGPQSALYGRAAFAGAFNYVTRDASDEFEAELNFEAAEHHEYEVSGSASGPVIEDVFGLRFSGYYWDERGQYTNIVTGEELGGGMGYGGALTANLNLTDSFSLKARLEYSDDEYEPRAIVGIPQTGMISVPANALGTVVDPMDPLLTGLRDTGTFGDADGFQLALSDNPRTPGKDYLGNDVEIFRASLIATWDVPGGTITSYSGFLDANTSEGLDTDYEGTPGGSVFLDTRSGNAEIISFEDAQIFSQELRFASDWQDVPLFGDRLQMTLGGNYWLNDKEIDLRGVTVNCFESLEFLPFGPPPGIPSVELNEICQDADVSLGFGSDDPASGPVDTWQEVVLLNEAMGTNISPLNHVKSRHLSAYIMLEWQAFEAWKLSFENRYVDEKFEMTRSAGNPCTFIAPFTLSAVCDQTIPQVSGRQDSNYHTPKVTLEWTPTENTLIYFSAAHARKPAGIEQLAPSGFAIPSLDGFKFASEKMNAYELGIKTTVSNGFGNLAVNVAAFFQDFSDKQVTVQVVEANGLLSRRTINAGSAEVIGAELDFAWQTPVEGLTFSGGYTYLPEAEYKEFFDTTSSPLDIAGAGNCAQTVASVFDFVSGMNVLTPQCIISFAGKRLERAPKQAFALSASLVRPAKPLNDWFGTSVDWFIEGDTRYRGKRFDDPDNLTIFENYIELDLRAGLQGENWQLLVFVDNVTGNNTFRTGSAGSAPDFGDSQDLVGAPFFSTTTGLLFHDFAILPPKRTVGVRGSIRF